jgi:multisubunit Na+/H+ antiporter MnhG subunit
MDTSRIVRAAAVSLVAGAFVQAGCGIAQIADPLLYGQPGFGLRNTIVAIGQLLQLVGILGVWRSAAAGGRLATSGLAATCVAFGLLVAAQLVEPFRPTFAGPLYAIAAPLLGAGMVAAGIAVIRAGRWSGWRRYAPLACGLYTFLVLLPAFAVNGGPSFPALATYSVCWLALGVALWTSDATSPRTTRIGVAASRAR